MISVEGVENEKENFSMGNVRACIRRTTDDIEGYGSVVGVV